MDIQLNSGLLIGVVSGIMLGIFALPQKRITNWKWENHWAGFTFFSAFLFPLIVALYTIPSCCQVIQLVPTKVLLQVFLLGSAWGIANIGYGISIHKLGIALGIAIVLGINSVVGTILPILIYQPERLVQTVGFWIILGILSMIIGIILTSFAGNVRLKEQVRTDDSGNNRTNKSSFITGVLIAVLTGVLAASFNFALLAGKPIEIIAIQYGATQANASNLTWLIGLSGGCLVTLCYCLILWKKLCKALHNFFKECKQHLGLGKCQAQDFDAQIAATTLCMLQYNLLSVVKRFNDYETLGELFRASQKDALSLTISEQVWLIIIELIAELSEIFNIDTEMLIEKLFSENEKLAKYLNFISLPQAG